MIQQYPGESLESVVALSLSINTNIDKSLTDQESEKNIAENIVIVGAFTGEEITKTDGTTDFPTKNSSSGLMITECGFVITAYHQIAPYISEWEILAKELKDGFDMDAWMKQMRPKYSVIDQKKKAHPIDVSCWITDPDHDLAIIKAVTQRTPQPVPFKICETNLKKKDPIRLFGLKNQQPYNQYGKIVQTDYYVESNEVVSGKKYTVNDACLTDAYSVPGFSGGVYITEQGQFAGISLYANTPSGEKIGYAGGVRAQTVVALVQKAIYYFGKEALTQ